MHFFYFDPQGGEQPNEPLHTLIKSILLQSFKGNHTFVKMDFY